MRTLELVVGVNPQEALSTVLKNDNPGYAHALWGFIGGMNLLVFFNTEY
ncbi:MULTISPECIES: hypothetical protein [Corynebacterium]|nr:MULTISPECIES: hypothetical protein [Corynebacterium]